MNILNILIVDDDETLRLTLKFSLEQSGFNVVEAFDGLNALEIIENSDTQFDIAILDVNMPRLDGLQSLERIKTLRPKCVCLMLTAHSDVKDAVKAIKLGAFDYLEKPIELEALMELIADSKKAHDMVHVAAFSAPTLRFSDEKEMIGKSDEIKEVFDIIYKLAKVDTSVLIRGESGTGKELVARALHYNSRRKRGPFVAINCGAMPENLIESELFGHEKGAFTGADRKKMGKFQYAEGGTLFLDEIGDISMAFQVKLLRALQDKIYTPVGSNQELKADIRIIAATNQPLEEMIQQNRFRMDLFYRLNVLPIHLPPLRERVLDIPTLIEYMIQKFNLDHKREITGVSPDAMHALKNYKWPGNIRELENVIEHAFILEPTSIITKSSLPKHIAPDINFQELSDELGSDLNYPILKEKFEKDFLIQALKTYEGKVNQTAYNTNMTKVTLLRKLEKYGINPKEYYKSQTRLDKTNEF